MCGLVVKVLGNNCNSRPPPTSVSLVTSPKMLRRVGVSPTVECHDICSYVHAVQDGEVSRRNSPFRQDCMKTTLQDLERSSCTDNCSIPKMAGISDRFSGLILRSASVDPGDPLREDESSYLLSSADADESCFPDSGPSCCIPVHDLHATFVHSFS